MQITNNGFLVTMTIIIIMALPVLIIRNSMKKTQEEIKKTHAVENKNIAVKDDSSKIIQSLLEKIKNLESTKKPTTKKIEKMKPCVWSRCV